MDSDYPFGIFNLYFYLLSGIVYLFILVVFGTIKALNCFNILVVNLCTTSVQNICYSTFRIPYIKS